MKDKKPQIRRERQFVRLRNVSNKGNSLHGPWSVDDGVYMLTTILRTGATEFLCTWAYFAYQKWCRQRDKGYRQAPSNVFPCQYTDLIQTTRERHCRRAHFWSLRRLPQNFLLLWLTMSGVCMTWYSPLTLLPTERSVVVSVKQLTPFQDSRNIVVALWYWPGKWY